MRSKMLKNTLMGLIFLTSTFMTSAAFAEMGKNGRIKDGFKRCQGVAERDR